MWEYPPVLPALPALADGGDDVRPSGFPRLPPVVGQDPRGRGAGPPQTLPTIGPRVSGGGGGAGSVLHPPLVGPIRFILFAPPFLPNSPLPLPTDPETFLAYVGSLGERRVRLLISWGGGLGHSRTRPPWTRGGPPGAGLPAAGDGPHPSLPLGRHRRCPRDPLSKPPMSQGIKMPGYVIPSCTQQNIFLPHFQANSSQSSCISFVSRRPRQGPSPQISSRLR